jgi:hypothetical protein
MENQSKISWVLVGIRSKNEGEQVEKEVAEKMLSEAFLPGKIYQLFLCGALVEDKSGTLEEMENGYKILLAGMEDYEYGDYGIISTHEEGNLLFMPVELSDEEIQQIDAQNLSGNTDTV